MSRHFCPIKSPDNFYIGMISILHLFQISNSFQKEHFAVEVALVVPLAWAAPVVFKPCTSE